MTLEFVLGDEGFEVVTAANGLEALASARERLPEVILLDHIMPKMDGKETLRALRADARLQGIPVLVLTGMSPDDEDWEGAELIGKPFSPDELVHRIRRLLERKV